MSSTTRQIRIESSIRLQYLTTACGYLLGRLLRCARIAAVRWVFDEEDAMAPRAFALDTLDIALLKALDENPRAGVLQLARLTSVARATVAARMSRLEASGVVVGYGPEIDLPAAGYSLQAFVTLEIAQGRLEEVTRPLLNLPGVIEAYATTGAGDVLCKIAATSNEDLQATLLELNRSPTIGRSTSVMILSTVVSPRTLPLLASGEVADKGRVRLGPHSDTSART